MRFVGERMRDSHDLWHVVTGYGTDVIGELALLAFTYAQTRHPGVGLISASRTCSSYPQVNKQIRQGVPPRHDARPGCPAVAWEELLDQPLEEVRAQLGVGAPPSYVPIPRRRSDACAARASPAHPGAQRAVRRSRSVTATRASTS